MGTDLEVATTTDAELARCGGGGGGSGGSGGGRRGSHGWVGRGGGLVYKRVFRQRPEPAGRRREKEMDVVRSVQHAAPISPLPPLAPWSATPATGRVGSRFRSNRLARRPRSVRSLTSFAACRRVTRPSVRRRCSCRHHAEVRTLRLWRIAAIENDPPICPQPGHRPPRQRAENSIC